MLWPPDAESWLTGRDPDAGKDWRQEEKGTTEGEMFGWHHRLNGHGFGWTLAVGDGREAQSAAVRGVTELDTTEWLNWTEVKMDQFNNSCVAFASMPAIFCVSVCYVWCQNWALDELEIHVVWSRDIFGCQ